MLVNKTSIQIGFYPYQPLTLLVLEEIYRGDLIVSVQMSQSYSICCRCCCCLFVFKEVESQKEGAVMSLH